MAIPLIFGLVIGSFLNVVIARVPEGKSIWRPRSACPGLRGADRLVRQRACALLHRAARSMPRVPPGDPVALSDRRSGDRRARSCWRTWFSAEPRFRGRRRPARRPHRHHRDRSPPSDHSGRHHAARHRGGRPREPRDGPRRLARFPDRHRRRRRHLPRHHPRERRRHGRRRHEARRHARRLPRLEARPPGAAAGRALRAAPSRSCSSCSAARAGRTPFRSDRSWHSAARSPCSGATRFSPWYLSRF